MAKWYLLRAYLLSCVLPDPPFTPPPCGFPPFTLLTILPKGQCLILPTDTKPFTGDTRYRDAITFLNFFQFSIFGIAQGPNIESNGDNNSFAMKMSGLNISWKMCWTPSTDTTLLLQSQQGWSYAQTRCSHWPAPRTLAQGHKLLCDQFFICLCKNRKK